MRTSGDCVWEKQHIWNIPDGLKKVIAGVVTVSLLVGIGDAVSMVPLQEDMRSYAATAGETIRWSVPIRLGQMVKQESILMGMEPHKGLGMVEKRLPGIESCKLVILNGGERRR